MAQPQPLTIEQALSRAKKATKQGKTAVALKLYDPNEDILPCECMIAIFPADRKHSSVYGGEKDRVMIGVNFYSL